MENTEGAYVGPMVILKSLPDVLAESLRRIEGITNDLEGYEVHRQGEIDMDVRTRTFIGETIIILHRIREECLVRNLTIGDAYHYVHNDFPSVLTLDTEGEAEDEEEQEEESDHEGYHGDDDQEVQDEQENEEDDRENHNEHRMGEGQDVDQLDELDEKMSRCSMNKRQRHGKPNPGF